MENYVSSIFQFFEVVKICFLQANTNINAAESRFGSVSRESIVSGVFNLEAPFSRIERWELYWGLESRKCSTISGVSQIALFGFSFAPTFTGERSGSSDQNEGGK